MPLLKETLSKFLRTVRQKVEDFVKDEGIGHKLQTLLEERALKTENWFADWWLDMAREVLSQSVLMVGLLGQHRHFSIEETC